MLKDIACPSRKLRVGKSDTLYIYTDSGTTKNIAYPQVKWRGIVSRGRQTFLPPKRSNTQINDKDRRSNSKSSEFRGYQLDSSKRCNSGNNPTIHLNMLYADGEKAVAVRQKGLKSEAESADGDKTLAVNAWGDKATNGRAPGLGNVAVRADGPRRTSPNTDGDKIVGARKRGANVEAVNANGLNREAPKTDGVRAATVNAAGDRRDSCATFT
ncbi:unnamed protein product [Onchocerca ochengi]|uniref:Transposase n=1 Tax=Onchocerca ochengi TaxID=42157 RepID=A0A182ELP6_ONCOC|nr:unnamed protein product [Onchocerca ochengi]